MCLWDGLLLTAHDCCGSTHDAEGLRGMKIVKWQTTSAHPNLPYLLLSEDAYTKDRDMQNLPGYYHHQRFEETLESSHRLTFSDQTTLKLRHNTLKLTRPIRMSLEYPIFRVKDGKVMRSHSLKVLALPGPSGALDSIVLQMLEPRDAQTVLYNAGARIVSQLSFEHDIPLDIAGWEWYSLRGNRAEVDINFMPTAAPAKFISHRSALKKLPQHLMEGITLWSRALAHYREGLLTPVPMYKFLAFFKGCQALSRLNADLNRAGYRFRPRYLTLPPGLAEHYPDMNNVAITTLINQWPVDSRNLVAHLELDRDDTAVFGHEDLLHDMIRYAQLAYIAQRAFHLMADRIRVPITSPSE